MCLVSGRMEQLPSFLCACQLCSHRFVFPCLEVSLRAISSKALPGHSVDVDSLHIYYADILISQVRAFGGSPRFQLTIDDVFWNATILHTVDMTQPSQSALYTQWNPYNITRQSFRLNASAIPACAKVVMWLCRPLKTKLFRTI